MDGLYVFNNPWSVQVDGEAHVVLRDDARSACRSPRRGWCRRRRTSRTPDLEPTLERYAKLFDLGADRQRSSATRCS